MSPIFTTDKRALLRRILTCTGAALTHPLGKIFLSIALLIGGAVLFYKAVFPTYSSYRYRMTVEVEVNGKVYSGASVIEVTINRQPQIGSAPPYVPYIRGDAVFVDLGKGRNVIALLAAGPSAENANYSDNIVPALFKVPVEHWPELGDMRGTREVPASRMPTFVTFADLNDPKSARVVRPEDFENEFGAGASLRSVTVEMTVDPVTRKIVTKLPWLSHMERYRTVPTNPFSNTLRFGRPLFTRDS
jgi:hypothetical protein